MPVGAPIGNQNAVKGKRWQVAIDKALANRCKSDGQAALVALAEKMLEAAENGEAWALKELGDRLDGKPSQTQIIEGGETPLVVEKRARFVSPTGA